MKQKQSKFSQILDKAKKKFSVLPWGGSGFDAVDPSNRRPNPTKINNTDEALQNRYRMLLLAGVQDMSRNSGLAKFAIDRHLDYVSSFTFQSRITDKALSDSVERLMRQYQTRHCDITGRFGLAKFMRLIEANRTVFGDVLVVFERGRLRLVESDRIGNPSDQQLPGTWVEGVKIDQIGRPVAYAIINRTNKNLEMVVNGDSAMLISYTDDYSAYRGVSPLAASLNSLKDLHKASDLLLQKIQISAAFGLTFTREHGQALDAGIAPQGEESEDQEIDFSKGPFVSDLKPGEDVKIVESATPSTQTQEYIKATMMMVLKSLGIPYCMYDESVTNYYGSKAALGQYMNACKSRRSDLIEFLNTMTAKVIQGWVDDKILVLPAGVSVANLEWEWVPNAPPPLDPAKESIGIANMISLGVLSFQDAAAQYGSDFYSNISKNAEAVKFASDNGIKMDMLGKINIDAQQPGPAVPN